MLTHQEIGLVMDLRARYGLAAVLEVLEQLERREAEPYRAANLMAAADHLEVAGALRVAGEIAAQCERRSGA